MKLLAIFLFLAFLLASCSDEDPADPIAPPEPDEPEDGFDLHIMDMRADLSVLLDMDPEELTVEFRNYPGLPADVLIGLVYLEMHPSRAESLVELAVGTKVDFPVGDCSVQIFMRHHVLNPRALTDTISSEQRIAYVKGRNIIAFRRFGQIDSVMSDITWRVVILCSDEGPGVTPF